MKKLNNEEMMEISGGGISKWVWAVIGGALAFCIGVIDGIVNPQKCNS